MRAWWWVATLVLVGASGCRKPVETLQVTPAALLMTSRGQVSVLEVQALGPDGQPVETPLTFSSSDASVASVDAQGQVTAHKSGEAVIVTRAGEKSRSTEVQVRIPARIEVTPSAVTIVGLGGTARFEARVLDDLGRELPGAVVNWTVDDPRLASVVGGTVTGMRVGASQVTVSFGSVAEVAHIEVKLPPFASVELAPSAVKLVTGEHELLLASVKNDRGERVAGVPIAFESSAPEVASVDQGGKVTGGRPGRATITARAGDHTAAVPVTVRAR